MDDSVLQKQSESPENTNTEFQQWMADRYKNRLAQHEVDAADTVYQMLRGALICASELLERPSEETVMQIFLQMMRRVETPNEVPIRGR